MAGTVPILPGYLPPMLEGTVPSMPGSLDMKAILAEAKLLA